MKKYKSDKFLNEEIDNRFKKKNDKFKTYRGKSKICKRFLRNILKRNFYFYMHPIPKKIIKKNKEGKKVIINPNYSDLTRNQKRNTRNMLTEKYKQG